MDAAGAKRSVSGRSGNPRYRSVIPRRHSHRSREHVVVRSDTNQPGGPRQRAGPRPRPRRCRSRNWRPCRARPDQEQSPGSSLGIRRPARDPKSATAYARLPSPGQSTDVRAPVAEVVLTRVSTQVPARDRLDLAHVVRVTPRHILSASLRAAQHEQLGWAHATVDDALDRGERDSEDLRRQHLEEVRLRSGPAVPEAPLIPAAYDDLA